MAEPRRVRYSVLSLAFTGWLVLGASPSPVSAQQEAVVEQLASVLAAEDARNFQPALFGSALVSPDSVVRRMAALGAGRIGDRRATSLVVPLLTDPDSTVRVAAAFSLGLLRDPAGARPLMERVTGVPALDGPTSLEAITALAKIGGREVGGFFEGLLAGSVVPTSPDRRLLANQAVLESWRLGRNAPVVAILPFLEDTAVSLRWRSAYTLGRLQAPAAANRLTVALRDPEPVVRAMAARALSRSYVDSGGLAARAVGQLLGRATADANPQVKINALRSLAGFEDSTLTTEIVPLLDDPLPNVQVQAAMTTGALGGAEAARALARVAAANRPFGVRREALVGLARINTAAFTAAAGRW